MLARPFARSGQKRPLPLGCLPGEKEWKRWLSKLSVTPILEEFREEVATTKRVLERVPGWKPDLKAITYERSAVESPFE